jgi:hypothetical protein
MVIDSEEDEENVTESDHSLKTETSASEYDGIHEEKRSHQNNFILCKDKPITHVHIQTRHDNTTMQLLVYTIQLKALYDKASLTSEGTIHIVRQAIVKTFN